MRSYPRNSPEAAGRLVALVLLSDGHVCRSELDAIERLDPPAALALQPGELGRLMQTLCEDLLTNADASGSLMASVDEATLASLMGEVDDPVLQREVLRLAHAAAQGDKHLADGEAWVLDAARRHWGLAAAPSRIDAVSLAA
jgi:hypothetical protein